MTIDDGLMLQGCFTAETDRAIAVSSRSWSDWQYHSKNMFKIIFVLLSANILYACETIIDEFLQLKSGLLLNNNWGGKYTWDQIAVDGEIGYLNITSKFVPCSNECSPPLSRRPYQSVFNWMIVLSNLTIEFETVYGYK